MPRPHIHGATIGVPPPSKPGQGSVNSGRDARSDDPKMARSMVPRPLTRCVVDLSLSELTWPSTLCVTRQIPLGWGTGRAPAIEGAGAGRGLGKTRAIISRQDHTRFFAG